MQGADAEGGRVSKWRRPVIVLVLVAQNSALAIVMRHSQAEERAEYATTTAVFAAETTKMIVSVLVQTTLDGGPRGLWRTFCSDVVGRPIDLLKMAVPAVLYTCQNNLAYVAAANLDGPTYQVMYQLKILTTAVFSVTMLRRTLSIVQWSSLLILITGVCVVQGSYPEPEGAPVASGGGAAAAAAAALHAVSLVGGSGTSSVFDGRGGSAEESALATLSGGFSGFGGFGDFGGTERLTGVLAVLAACLTSGFAGVYFEKALKGSPISLWVRNFELSAFGALVALAGVWLNDSDHIAAHGWFGGYDAVVWTSVALNSLGGLVVGLVVKYLDSVVKGFATSISLVATCVVSYLLFAFDITLPFLAGAGLVLWATFLYTTNPRPPASCVRLATATVEAAALAATRAGWGGGGGSGVVGGDNGGKRPASPLSMPPSPMTHSVLPLHRPPLLVDVSVPQSGAGHGSGASSLSGGRARSRGSPSNRIAEAAAVAGLGKGGSGGGGGGGGVCGAAAGTADRDDGGRGV